MTSLKVLDLQNNPLQCDENFKNLTKLLRTKKVNRMIEVQFIDLILISLFRSQSENQQRYLISWNYRQHAVKAPPQSGSILKKKSAGNKKKKLWYLKVSLKSFGRLINLNVSFPIKQHLKNHQSRMTALLVQTQMTTISAENILTPKTIWRSPKKLKIEFQPKPSQKKNQLRIIFGLIYWFLSLLQSWSWS